VPDCTADYTQNGVNDEQPTWLKPSGDYVLWYLGAGDQYLITTIADLGTNPPTNYWLNPQNGIDPTGTYDPYGTFTGTPEIALIP
jgi:hypothetical protein